MPVILNEPNASYHSNEAVSHSKLECFRYSPQLYYRKYIEKSLIEKPTKAMEFGTAFHMHCLEFEKFRDTYVPLSADFDGRTKQGKALIESIEGNKRKALYDDDNAKILGMTGQLYANQTAVELIYKAVTEVAFRANVGISIQCRADIWRAADYTVADLKTCADIETFERNFFNLGYHRQAAFYVACIKEVLRENGKEPEKIDFVFIACETSQPYRCRIYRPSESALEIGGIENNQDLKELMRRQKENDWSDVDTSIRELALPKWYRSVEDDGK